MEQALLMIIAVLLGIILLTLWVVLYQLVKQQGRLLLGQDELERRLMHLGVGAGTNGSAARAPSQPAGLSVGTPFPSFRLPDLQGHEVGLDDFRGKRVLLINWSPQCGFCDLIAPDLARLQADLRKRDVQVVLAAHGDARANRQLAQEHGLEAPILLQKGKRRLEAFEYRGTPAAYLLDEQGRVAQALEVGADRVLDLARAAAVGTERKRLPGERPLSTSRLVRDGLKAGTPAPPFRLPDVHGREVALEDFRGRWVLLVFSDPHCGPCDQLAPHLVRLQRQHRDDGLAVVLVGRGAPEENRRKAEQHGFEFSMVLQQRWELSKEYGIFATPVAFLIDERGVIARDVAKGVDEIRALISVGTAAEKS